LEAEKMQRLAAARQRSHQVVVLLFGLLALGGGALSSRGVGGPAPWMEEQHGALPSRSAREPCSDRCTAGPLDADGLGAEVRRRRAEPRVRRT
jgi:hypothetical protein